jgi:hypothetical protein
MRQKVLTAKKNAAYIYGHLPVPFFECGLLDFLVYLNGRIVHQYVYGVKAASYGPGQLLDRTWIGDICVNRQRRSTGFRYLSRGLLCRLRIYICRDHIRSFLRECPRDRPADTGPGASDDRCFISQTHCILLLLSSILTSRLEKQP